MQEADAEIFDAAWRLEAGLGDQSFEDRIRSEALTQMRCCARPSSWRSKVRFLEVVQCLLLAQCRRQPLRASLSRGAAVRDSPPIVTSPKRESSRCSTRRPMLSGVVVVEPLAAGPWVPSAAWTLARVPGRGWGCQRSGRPRVGF
ncbi:hypothetical protein D3C73_1048110 [compost metagenome]